MENSDYYFRDNCRICSSKKLTKAFELAPTPPGNDLLKKTEIGREEGEYPLEVYFCENCFHIQLGHVVKPEILYQKNYTYVSGTSHVFVNHLRQYASSIINNYNLNQDSFVIDIGSNDGTCLSFFKEKGMRVLGVDPATEISLEASKRGIETISEFFSLNLAINLKKKYGPADFITSHNACAHIDDLFDIVQGVKHLLNKNGLFVFEVGYFVDVFSNSWFDTIYHEHLDFHTVSPLQKLFDRVNMEVISVERVSPQGGSIRVVTQNKGGKFKKDLSVDKLISLEKQLKLNEVSTLVKFYEKINIIKNKLKKLVNDLRSDGKTIAGFGAPTKATTLMAYFDLDKSILDFIVDDNPLKQGLYSPLTHIPILPSSALYERKPDYVLILAWNFAEPIMAAHSSYSQEIGDFILPMPDPQIV
jgi:SAM-dependent methyltransferase